MKKVISWLIRRDESTFGSPQHWWWLEETKHSTPPEERTWMYTWPQIVTMMRSKLGRFKE